MNKSNKVIVIWISNANGLTSCHLNNGGSYKDSYIGHIKQKDGLWYSVLKGDDINHGPHQNYYAAKKHVQESINGETL